MTFLVIQIFLSHLKMKIQTKLKIVIIHVLSKEKISAQFQIMI